MKNLPLRIHLAATWRDRLSGLHAYPVLPANFGLWLLPCRAIHTIGLSYPIDAVFLDPDHAITTRFERLAPYRYAFCMSARSVIELPGGYCAEHPGYQDHIRRALCALGVSLPGAGEGTE